MDVLFLTNNDNTKELVSWIGQKVQVFCLEERLTLDKLRQYNPKLVISYNYKYIVPEECINYMNHRIINMHISYLPWNKGFSPNIWSFIDKTPKGVSIHEMTAALDDGGILFQKQLVFDIHKETLSTTYERLNKEIVQLCKSHWDEIYSGDYTVKEQLGPGSMHTIADLKYLRTVVDFSWDDVIVDFLERYSTSIGKAL